MNSFERIMTECRNAKTVTNKNKIVKESRKTSDKKQIKESFDDKFFAIFKPFTEDDWYTYTGAERFSDGSDPHIKYIDKIFGTLNGKEVEELYIIADGNGVYSEVYYKDNHDTGYLKKLSSDSHTRREAVRLYNEITKIPDSEDISYIFKDLNYECLY